MKTDWLIVGAGFTGAVLASRIARELGRRVVVVEKRGHVGGNAYDFYDPHGVLVHKYGPHIFHTNSEKVWRYLSGFTAWRPYEHRVLGEVEGQRVPIPFNFTSLHALFPEKQARAIEKKLLETYAPGAKVPILRLLDAPDDDVRAFARYVYDHVFDGYSRKQWGMEPADLDPSVTARVPVRLSHDDRHFQDRFQAMPADGYTALFARLLDHPNIRVHLETDYRDVADALRFERMVYTGPIDAFFDYAHGPLPYRSLAFEFVYTPGAPVQPVAQINYPNAHAFTRTTEFVHLTGQQIGGTTVAFEYPMPHRAGENEPYYPIPRERHRLLHARYADDARSLDGRVFFAGRLADYTYYNMDQAVARAFTLFERQIVPLHVG